MAAKLLLLSPPTSAPPTVPESRNSIKTHRFWSWNAAKPKSRRLPLPARSSLQETLASPLVLAHQGHHPSSLSIFLADSTAGGYSLASYYTSLGLFIISVPGLWSLIKRSVKSKIVQKTFITDGDGKMVPNQVGGQILSFFTRNNFTASDRGETITYVYLGSYFHHEVCRLSGTDISVPTVGYARATPLQFEGMMVPSRSQAALLTFCTCVSLASVALVLTIAVPDLGNSWFWLTAFSPLAGLYYWTKASRKEQIKVKMMVADDGTLSEIIVQGDDQQVDQMRRELQLKEKGMVYVKGIFER